MYPPFYYILLAADLHLGIQILHQCSAGRSAMISTLRDNIQIIFDSYNHIQPPSIWSRDRKSRNMTQFRKLLSFNPDPTQINDDSPLKADTYPPLMYAGLIKHTSNAFRHPALIKVSTLRSSDLYNTSNCIIDWTPCIVW